MSYPPQQPPQHPYGQGGSPQPPYQQGQQPYQQYPPGGQMPPGGPMHPGPPGMFPPPPQQKPRGPLIFGVVAAVAVIAIAATALVLSGAFSSDEDEPTAISTDTTSEEPEPDPTTEAEPTEEEPTGGGTYAAVDDICAIMEPIVAGYMTIDPEETEVLELGGAFTCSMAGEFVDNFERPWVDVKQDVEPDVPGHGAEEYGYHEGIRGGCEVEEDVMPEFESSAYFHGDSGSGCTILGQSYGLHVADGNMLIAVGVFFGTDGFSMGGEKELLIELAQAMIAES